MTQCQWHNVTMTQCQWHNITKTQCQWHNVTMSVTHGQRETAWRNNDKTDTWTKRDDSYRWRFRPMFAGGPALLPEENKWFPDQNQIHGLKERKFVQFAAASPSNEQIYAIYNLHPWINYRWQIVAVIFCWFAEDLFCKLWFQWFGGIWLDCHVENSHKKYIKLSWESNKTPFCLSRWG